MADPNPQPALVEFPQVFGHLAILHAVHQLDGNNNQDSGSTPSAIRQRLIQNGVDNVPQTNVVRSMLSELRQRGDLMLGGQGPYTLHCARPRLPQWFQAALVLQAVQQLYPDGSNWIQIRDALFQEVLPPRFESVLKQFLSVLYQSGHLAMVDHVPPHYQGGQPGMVDHHVPPHYTPVPGPDNIPEFQLGYYLGYSLGYDAGFERWNPQLGMVPQPAMRLLRPEVPLWFTAETVLQAVQQLDGHNQNNNGSNWVQINNALLLEHPPANLPGFRLFLSELRKRGHLATGPGSPHLYTVPMPNPDPIPEFHWGYYLGFELGRRDGFGQQEEDKEEEDDDEDEDEDEEEMEID